MENAKEKAENRIIDSINMGASGRLIVFRSGNKELFADLAVEKRQDYKRPPILIKVFSKEIPSGDLEFEAKLPEQPLTQSKSFVIFTYFDDLKQNIEDALWIMPLPDFERILGSSQNNKLNPKIDKIFKNFLIDKKDLGAFFVEKFGK